MADVTSSKYRNIDLPLPVVLARHYSKNNNLFNKAILLQNEQQCITISDSRSKFLKGQDEKRDTGQEQKLMTYYYDAFVSYMITVYQASKLIDSKVIAPNISILSFGDSLLESCISLLELVPIAGNIVSAIKKLVQGIMEVKAINKANTIAHMAESEDHFKEIANKLALRFALCNKEKILYKNISEEKPQSLFLKVTSKFSDIWNNISERFLSKTPVKSDSQEIESLARENVDKLFSFITNNKGYVSNINEIFNNDDYKAPLLAQDLLNDLF